MEKSIKILENKKVKSGGLVIVSFTLMCAIFFPLFFLGSQGELGKFLSEFNVMVLVFFDFILFILSVIFALRWVYFSFRVKKIKNK